MEGLIIYKGKYGATRQYAEWLNKDLSLHITVAEEVHDQELEKSDYLLIGTSVYFGKFLIKHWLKKNAEKIKNKKLFLFVVTATSPDEKELRATFEKNNIPLEIKKRCEVYYVTGRIIHKELDWKDRFILKMASAFVKDPVKKSAMHTDLDGVKKENLMEIEKAVSDYLSIHSEVVSV